MCVGQSVGRTYERCRKHGGKERQREGEVKKEETEKVRRDLKRKLEKNSWK